MDIQIVLCSSDDLGALMPSVTVDTCFRISRVCTMGKTTGTQSFWFALLKHCQPVSQISSWHASQTSLYCPSSLWSERAVTENTCTNVKGLPAPEHCWGLIFGTVSALTYSSMGVSYPMLFPQFQGRKTLRRVNSENSHRHWTWKGAPQSLHQNSNTF